ncbi:MAG: outer membrane beta-barrel protein [Proteobacteria bacterium]|nr:outer membrane beta-barrel protein [Pseudomonadota bacterium]
MKKILVPMLLAGIAWTALPAQAEGLYVGGSIGPSHYADDNVGGIGMTDRSSTGGKLFGGYSFNPYLGIELGWADLGHFSSSAGGVKGDGVFVDAVGTWPVASNFSLLGRVGVFNGRLDAETLGGDTGTSYKVGLGVQYDLSKTVGLRGEWERYRFDALNSKPNADLFTVGLTYRF